jgi:hypothetical protein
MILQHFSRDEVHVATGHGMSYDQTQNTDKSRGMDQIAGITARSASMEALQHRGLQWCCWVASEICAHTAGATTEAPHLQ